MRLAFRHAVDNAFPNLPRSEITDLGAGVGLDVGGQAFFHPVLIVGQAGEGHVRQLVGHGPVVREIGLGDVRADAHASKARPSVHVAPGGPVDSLSIGGDNQDAGARNRKVSIVGGNGSSRLIHPLQKGGVGQVELAFSEIDLDLGTADLKSLGRGHNLAPKGTLGVNSHVEDKACQPQHGENAHYD